MPDKSVCFYPELISTLSRGFPVGYPQAEIVINAAGAMVVVRCKVVGSLWISWVQVVGRVLFANTEAGEDFTQQIIRGKFAGNLAEVVLALAQIFS